MNKQEGCIRFSDKTIMEIFKKYLIKLEEENRNLKERRRLMDMKSHCLKNKIKEVLQELEDLKSRGKYRDIEPLQNKLEHLEKEAILLKIEPVKINKDRYDLLKNIRNFKKEWDTYKKRKSIT
jgi:hypothetical protein